MSQYYPPYRSSSNDIKVELDLANYATKDDVKNITHVDVSSFTSKTNLAALKTEVDKIDTDKLKTTPADLAKLTNAIENDVVKKTDYNTKVTSIEAQIAGLTKNTVDNLADITKLKAIDTNSFVNKTKFSADINILYICYIDDFDVNSLKITKKESRIGALNLDNDTIIPLHFLIDRLIGFIEEIDGSSDKYLVVVSSLRNKNRINALDMVWSSIKDKINPGIKIKDYDKFRFNSDIDLPVNTITQFHSILINVTCVIEKDNEYYPEIYLDACSYVKASIY